MTDIAGNGSAPSRDRSIRRWLMTGLVVALWAAIVIYVARSPEDVALFRRLSAPVLLATLLLQCLSQLFYNGVLLLPLRAYVKDLGYWEFFMVRTGGFLLGYIVPVAGNIAVRLSYLRRRGIAYLDFTWATILSNVVALAAAATLAVAATAALWAAAGRPPARVFGLSGAVLALSVGALTAFHWLPRLAGRLRFGGARLAAFSGHRSSPRMMSRVFALSLARHCLNFVTFGWLYHALSPLARGFLTGGLVYAVASPLRMIQITPGNLGVDEWVAAMIGKALAFDVATGLIVAVVFRGLILLAQGVGVLIAWAWLELRSKA